MLRSNSIAIDIALKNPHQNYITFSDAKSVLLSLKHNNTNILTNPFFQSAKKIQEFSVEPKHINK